MNFKATPLSKSASCKHRTVRLSAVGLGFGCASASAAISGSCGRPSQLTTAMHSCRRRRSGCRRVGRAGFCVVLLLRTASTCLMPMCSTLCVCIQSTHSAHYNLRRMVDVTEPPERLAEAVEQHGQQHLLANWQELSTAQRQELAASLEVSCSMKAAPNLNDVSCI